MNKQLVLLTMLILLGINCFGESRQEKAARETIDRLKSDQRKLTDSANTLAAELTQYRINPPSFSLATNKIARLAQDRAWRDIYSRETKTHDKAEAQLKEAISETRRLLSVARESVDKFTNAEYLAWAKTHPEEARAREIQENLRECGEEKRLISVRGKQLSVNGGAIDESEFFEKFSGLSNNERRQVRNEIAAQIEGMIRGGNNPDAADRISMRTVDLSNPHKFTIRNGNGDEVRSFQKIGANGKPRRLTFQDYEYFRDNVQ